MDQQLRWRSEGNESQRCWGLQTCGLWPARLEEICDEAVWAWVTIARTFSQVNLFSTEITKKTCVYFRTSVPLSNASRQIYHTITKQTRQLTLRLIQEQNIDILTSCNRIGREKSIQRELLAFLTGSTRQSELKAMAFQSDMSSGMPRDSTSGQTRFRQLKQVKWVTKL